MERVEQEIRERLGDGKAKGGTNRGRDKNTTIGRD